jgi:hypothetical protein
VVKEDSTAEMRQVTLGQREGDLVIVRSGVKSGDRVITTGQIAVMPGGKVRIEEPQSPAGAAVAPGAQPADKAPAKPEDKNGSKSGAQPSSNSADKSGAKS